MMQYVTIKYIVKRNIYTYSIGIYINIYVDTYIRKREKY